MQSLPNLVPSSTGVSYRKAAALRAIQIHFKFGNFHRAGFVTVTDDLADVLRIEVAGLFAGRDN